MRIYVASSWRNEHQPEVVRRLREAGHLVYDFRRPTSGGDGFHWSEIDPAWRDWSAEAFAGALDHDVAERGFNNDFDAMMRAEAVVLVLPCGRSAHLELGWAAGRGLPTYVLFDGGKFEPELMYKMCSHICLDVQNLIEVLAHDEDGVRKSYDEPALRAEP